MGISGEGHRGPRQGPETGASTELSHSKEASVPAAAGSEFRGPARSRPGRFLRGHDKKSGLRLRHDEMTLQEFKPRCVIGSDLLLLKYHSRVGTCRLECGQSRERPREGRPLRTGPRGQGGRQTQEGAVEFQLGRASCFPEEVVVECLRGIGVRPKHLA